ncbi:MAG: lipocalin-like domain-containing protein [Xanthobacteraceae bacterium]|nr:lipocalin-like domain-containing protein [Xanthobacteraceae bacterium]
MRWNGSFAIVATTLMAFAMAAGSAFAQKQNLKEQLLGTWQLVSWVAKSKDGAKTDPMGSEPKGVIIFDSGGGFYFIMIGDIPKLASNIRQKTTAEENRAIALGTFAYFGTYTVNEADKSFNVRVERSSYGNQVGTNNKRMITSLTPTELKFTTPVTTSGGSNDWSFRRAP